MLNLSPIRQEQAIRFAKEEADGLLAAYPASGGIDRLLQGVARIRTERAVELSVVNEELDDLVRIVCHALAAGDTCSGGLRTAVATLAYLRNPYDKIFDLQVEGGLDDDIAVIRNAWATLKALSK